MLEMHGTGTGLGDPIEVHLLHVFLCCNIPAGPSYHDYLCWHPDSQNCFLGTVCAWLCNLKECFFQHTIAFAQIGAAFTVLQSAGTEEGAPLELQAAKSRLLHLEPAAGAAGLTQLLARLQQTPSHETLHLRSVNSHVATIFQVGMAGSLRFITYREAPWVHAALGLLLPCPHAETERCWQDVPVLPSGLRCKMLLLRLCCPFLRRPTAQKEMPGAG